MQRNFGCDPLKLKNVVIQSIAENYRKVYILIKANINDDLQEEVANSMSQCSFHITWVIITS